MLALYSVRLFVLGLPPLMKAPRDKTAAYTLLVSIAGIILALVVSAVVCFFLARYLVLPVDQLRRATRQIQSRSSAAGTTSSHKYSGSAYLSCWIPNAFSII